MYRVARTSGERRDEEEAKDVSARAAVALVGGAGVGAWQRCKQYQCKVPGVRGQSERGRVGEEWEKANGTDLMFSEENTTPGESLAANSPA